MLDTALRKLIEEALEWEPSLDASAVIITIDGDTVRLDGRVRAWFERETLEKAAWAAPGVRQVDDQVRIG